MNSRADAHLGRFVALATRAPWGIVAAAAVITVGALGCSLDVEDNFGFGGTAGSASSGVTDGDITSSSSSGDAVEGTSSFSGSSSTTGTADADTEPDEPETTGDTGDTGDTDGLPDICEDPGVCVSAMPLGSVSGDSGSTDLVASGTQPTWVSFRVTEDNDSVSGEELRFRVSLTTPLGVDFDINVYRGSEGGSTGCNGNLAVSNNVGSDLVTMSWGEGAVADASNNDAYVAVEILSKDNTCDPAQVWNLVVTGDV